MLQADQLTKKYGSRLVVDRLSLTVEKGDIFGFLGQNGAGKSTVLRMVLGLVKPTSGRVLLCGQDISKYSLKVLGHVGALVESPAFYGNFSGFDNLRMFAALSGGASRKRIEHVLEMVDLLPRGRDLVRSYSHGMRQRLGLAQALLPNPKFVILDEPTDGLDPRGIREVRLLLPRLRDELDLTILLSSHLLSEVECICNKIGIIDQGRLLYQGSVSDLSAPLEEVFITLTEG